MHNDTLSAGWPSLIPIFSQKFHKKYISVSLINKRCYHFKISPADQKYWIHFKNSWKPAAWGLCWAFVFLYSSKKNLVRIMEDDFGVHSGRSFVKWFIFKLISIQNSESQNRSRIHYIFTYSYTFHVLLLMMNINRNTWISWTHKHILQP